MCYAFIQPIPYMAIIWWHDEGNTLFGGTHRGYGGGASPLEGWGIARDKNLDINKYDMVMVMFGKYYWWILQLIMVEFYATVIVFLFNVVIHTILY